jgi:HNH endonuclease
VGEGEEVVVTSRRALPVATRRAVLAEAGYRCAVSTCRTILALDLHHIEDLQEGGGDEVSNLIALCPTCHTPYPRGTITRDAIRSWKGLLVALNQAGAKNVARAYVVLGSTVEFRNAINVRR